MTFNQVIWDVLIAAYENGDNQALQALEAYAAEHDGRLSIEMQGRVVTGYQFTPNPISKY
jgi:hypothetical protein